MRRSTPLDGGGAPIETVLLAIWSSVFGVRITDTRASFFDLGGDSLRALRMLREVELVFGTALPLTVLFEADTVELIAHHVSAAVRGAEGEPRDR